MTVYSDYTFAVYSLNTAGDTATSRTVVFFYDGAYSPDGLDADGILPFVDDRPVNGRGGYDSATMGWVALPSLPALEPAQYQGSGSGEAVTNPVRKVNPTTSVVTPAAVAASLEERQGKVAQDIEAKVTEYQHLQDNNQRLTDASRVLIGSYINNLRSMLVSPTWATNPESIAWPTEPTAGQLTFSDSDTGIQNAPTTGDDTVDYNWFVSGGYADAVSYPTATGQTGTRVLRVAAKSAQVDSEIRLRFDKSKVLRAKFRIRRVGAAGVTPGKVYAGVACYDVNGAFLAMVWCALKNIDQAAFTADAWTIFNGYIAGTQLAAADNDGTPSNPSKLPEATAMIAPRVWFNSNGSLPGLSSGSSTMELDFADIQVADDVSGTQLIESTVSRSKFAFGDLGTLQPEMMFDNPDPTQFELINGTLTFDTVGANSGGSYGILTKTSAAGGGDCILRSIAPNYVSVEGGSIYTARLSWKLAAGTFSSNTFMPRVRYYNEAKQPIGSPIDFVGGNLRPTSSSWTRTDGKFVMPSTARWATLELAIASAQPAGAAVGVDNFRLIQTHLNDDIADGGINDVHIVGLDGLKLFSSSVTTAQLNPTAATSANGSDLSPAPGTPISSTTAGAYPVGSCFVGAKYTTDVLVGCSVEIENETTVDAAGHLNMQCVRSINGGSEVNVFSWWFTLSFFAHWDTRTFIAYDQITGGNENERSVQYTWEVNKRSSNNNVCKLGRATTAALARYR